MENKNDADVVGYCCLRFPVSDLRKSVTFYCEVLGFTLIRADYSFGEAYIGFKNGNRPGIFLMETKPEAIKPLKFAFPHSFFVTNREGYVTMVELLTNNLMASYDRIKEAGVTIEQEPAYRDDFGYFTLYDPDGHHIRVVEENVNHSA